MLGWLPPPVPLLPMVAVGLAVWYLVAVRIVRSHGRQWTWMRTASFLAGCTALAAVTGLAIDSYGYRLFSAFMFQHLTLSILVPPLLVLGAPGRLLLRSTPHRGVGRYVLIAALGALRCRASRIVLHPGFTIPVFLLSYYGLYLSDLFDAAAASVAGHVALQVFFLASGLLFILPILSTGPLPVRQSNLGRFFDIFVEMPLHVFIGVILMMAPRALTDTFAQPPANWNVDPVADQAVAGALAWSYGEPVALLTTLIFAIRWRRDEESESAKREADVERGDAELAAYNAFLRGLHQRPPRPTGAEGVANEHN
ncbi:cytochrome c oxidase assembly protein [Mycobacterium barrassiae]|uniref:cytochrome c oxidase assembly protein n=1 Tax=Mycobacterium barrassiae TaxID=319709 RepID=UPI00220359BA|nr:cytochrome c oxidase assembly protein [Mycobacterium barrassiae]MCV7303574.1 cytochrome c oxidase assembly protein [Mycobacterium barrassiae]UUO02063.1 cytochrome c oxidase assembly protein [Mycolicibacterium novocastrense]